MMKFYIAAKFNDKDRVKIIYDILKEHGYTITHEWIHNKASAPFSQDVDFTAQCAKTDLQAVSDSDVFILLSNSEPSMGASAELGGAITSYLHFKKPVVYVIGPHFDSNFFFWHPEVKQKESIQEILEELAR